MIAVTDELPHVHRQFQALGALIKAAGDMVPAYNLRGMFQVSVTPDGKPWGLLTVPNALLHNLKHNKVLHEINLFVTVRNHEIPWVGLNKRVEIESLGHDCWQVIVNYGFKNDTDLPKALQQLKGRGCELDAMSTSYFLSRDIVIPTIGSGMAQWREKLFAQMHHNASAAAEFLQLPNNAVVELGSKIEI